MHDPTPLRQGPVPGGRKVGRKPAFSAEDVIAAAIAEGVDRFTLSAVAKRLGVVTAAIYRIFDSRDDLVIACLDTAGATIRLPEPDMHWRDTLRLWADECWRVCEEHPGLSHLVYSYPLAPTRITGVFRAYAESLATQGKTREQAMFAIGVLADTVFASRWSAEALRAVDEHGKSGLDTVREKQTHFQPEKTWIDREALDIKVDFILSGLEHHWPESTSTL